MSFTFTDTVRALQIIYCRETTLSIMEVFNVICPVFLNVRGFLQIAVFAWC